MTVLNSFPSTRLLIVSALITMLVLSFISFTRINKINQLSTHVNHSNLIKLILQETYSDLSDADSELSKHILTSDISYRRRMQQFENKITNSIEKLKSLTASNGTQTKSIDILDSLIRRRFELMSTELQMNGKDYKEITSSITDCNAQIISLINTLKENENNTLAEMEESVQEYRRWTPVMIFTFEIIVIISLIFAYSRTDKELRIKRSLQKELESQIQFKTAILDNSVDIILVLDTESKLIVANKKAVDLLGITDGMIGKNIFSLFPTAENSITQKSISQSLGGEHIHIPKHRALSINLTLESFFIPLYTKNKVTAVIIIHHDISELSKALEDLEESNEKLKKMNLNLEQFAFVASHDLQEPLRKITIYSDFAEKSKNDSDKLSSYLSRISASAERLSKLIKNILSFSRASFNVSETEPVDLNVVYRQVIQDLELFIEERNATINSVILPIVDGYAPQLSQVFFNLIHNALKFCYQRPVITISCRTENDFYVISISDNGIGFEQSYENQIFEVFKQVPGKQAYSGSGIGLAICKKIVVNHKGSISVQSEPDKGTTFEIRLPVAKPPVNNLIPTLLQ